MELALIIYLIDLLSGFSVDNVFGTVFLIGLAVVAACIVKYQHTDVGDKFGDEADVLRYNAVVTIIKKFLVFAGVLFAIGFFSPSKETSYAMLAAYGVQTVAESEQVQEVAGKSLKVLEKYMDDYLVETPKESGEHK